MRVLYIEYSLWKDVIAANSFGTIYESNIASETSKIWAGTSDLIYNTDVVGADYVEFNATHPVRQEVVDEDEVIARVAGLSGSLAPRQNDGVPLVTFTARLGREVIYATHNLTDPTTWYSESERVNDQTLNDTGDGLTWVSPDSNWIDMRHGKILDEDGLAAKQAVLEPSNPHQYGVKITADGVEMTSHDPFTGIGGDYSIDFANGRVTFDTSQAGKVVKAEYSKSVGTGWILQPLPGKALVIEDSEVQFSNDAEMNNTFIRTVYGSADYFLTQAERNALGIPTGANYSIPIKTTRYKTIDQIIDEAVSSFPPVPAVGGSRGFSQPKQIFKFKYGTASTLWSSLGMYVRISMDDGPAFTGERVTATFYCTSVTDSSAEEALKRLSS